MAEGQAKVLHSEKEEREKGNERILVELMVEMDKKDYFDELDDFYHKRDSALRKIITSPTSMQHLLRIEKDRVRDTWNIELTFFDQLRHSLLNKILFDRFYHTFFLDQEKGKVDVSFRNQKFDGLINIIFKIPKIREVRKLFHTVKEKIALPQITYYYALSGEGEKEEVKGIIEKYAKIVEVQPPRETFHRGERAVIKNSQKNLKSGKIKFRLNTEIEILPEYFTGREELRRLSYESFISGIKRYLFEDYEEGLLSKLFKEVKFGHNVNKKREGETEILIKSPDDSLQAKLYLAIKDGYSSFASLIYNIEGEADYNAKENVDYLLKEYFPSREENPEFGE